MDASATLERRLANFRAGLRATTVETTLRPAVRPRTLEPSARLAAVLDAEIVVAPTGTYLRIERPSVPLPVDRDRLATLPGQPPPSAPLVCLDTETTGLATAAGTLAFLIGLGWWERDAFRQVQLLLPDHADEPAMLAALADHLPPDAWLVTYNGRGFDWPLLVARYRMARRDPPALEGHLDLLPLVRRVFRHRMTDARLRTVETSLLGVRRVGDVDGWEIPGRYLEFLRGGSPRPLVDVVRHNDEDVRSLARLLGHVERRFGDRDALTGADPGDVAGLARAYARERRLEDALRCLELAIAAPPPARVVAPPLPSPPGSRREALDDWWSPRRAADFGGRPRPPARADAPVPLAAPWTEERLAVDRAHLLRRLGRHDDAAEAWAGLAAGSTRLAALAAVELAKVREHRLGDRAGALAAVDRGWAILERRRRIGRPEPALEMDLARRGARLRRRLDRDAAAAVRASGLSSAR